MRTVVCILLSLMVFISCQTTQQTGGSQIAHPSEKNGAKPALKNVEMPKIGLILGPGAFKSYAHLGVLREFEKAGFKVHAIVGLEWGALMGALYSMKGRANDLEWQLSKLKRTDLPQNASFGPNFQSESIKSFSSYLDTVFQKHRFEDNSISFACPSQLLVNGKSAWWDRGGIRTAMEKCMSFPPLFKSVNGWVASAFDIQDASKKLHEMGAEIVVLVNVLARGQIIKADRVRSQDEAEIIWWDGVHKLNTVQSGIDWIIGIHSRNYDILDFEARQSFVMFGQEFGAAAARKMAEQYGL